MKKTNTVPSNLVQFADLKRRHELAQADAVGSLYIKWGEARKCDIVLCEDLDTGEHFLALCSGVDGEGPYFKIKTGEHDIFAWLGHVVGIESVEEL